MFFFFHFAVRHPRSGRTPQFSGINPLTGATLPLIMQRPGLWVKPPSAPRGAACTSAYVTVLLCSLRRAPKGAAGVDAGLEISPRGDSFRRRTLLIVYLSAGAFHHFWCLRASCFQKSRAKLSSPAYFLPLRIINTRIFGCWSASQVLASQIMRI